MAKNVEPGGSGRLFSLNFSAGGLNRGRVLDSNSIALADSTLVQVLNANPNRSWALLVNNNASNVLVYLGVQNVAPITLAQYGVAQIDQNLPWSGEVLAYQTSGAPVNLAVIEASIQQ